MADKDQIAQRLARAHREVEPEIVRIVRLLGHHEAELTEPVKLLEVNPGTSPSGVVPIAFAADPPDVPFATVVVEVTPSEYARIVRGELALPNGWCEGTTLYEASAAA